MSEKNVQLNKEVSKRQLKELVRGSAEETLNEMLEAVGKVLPQEKYQRCTVHFYRNDDYCKLYASQRYYPLLYESIISYQTAPFNSGTALTVTDKPVNRFNLTTIFLYMYPTLINHVEAM